MSQPVVELRRGFLSRSLALAERLGSPSKFLNSRRRLFESFQGYEELPELLFGRFLEAGGIAGAAMLQRDFRFLSIRLPTTIHSFLLMVRSRGLFYAPLVS
jgi:hypothetical protein